MSFVCVLPYEWQACPMGLLAKEKMLLTVADGETVNPMTVGWGGFGVMWGIPVMMFAVRPTRYTHALLAAGVEVSLCALPPEMGATLSYCGSHSGCDGDKCRAAGLTPIRMAEGGVGLAEARLVLAGRLVYSHQMQEAELYDSCRAERWYATEPYHTYYIASVEHIYCKQ